MTTTLDKNAYPYLFGPNANYALIVQTSFTQPGGGNTSTTTITNGSYGPTSVVNTRITGTPDDSNISAAITNITQLTSDINSLTTTETVSSVTDTVINGFDFFPGVYLFDTQDVVGSTGTQFQGNLTFTATYPSQQFIIKVPSNYFIILTTNAKIILQGQAQASNIFWYSDREIVFTNYTNPSYGVFVGNSVNMGNAGDLFINGNVFANTYQAGTSFQGRVNVFIDAPAALCLLKGTKLMTNRGEVAIEDITEGDQLVTYGKINQHTNKELNIKKKSLLKTVKWCGHFSVADFNTMTYPICFKAHSLGENMPSEDLYVSPGHGIIMNNTLIFAHKLINNTTIFQDKSFTSIEYYHIKVDGHHVIQANGVFTETLNYDMKKIENRPDLYTKNEEKTINMPFFY